jgi:hypothetical protein
MLPGVRSGRRRTMFCGSLVGPVLDQPSAGGRSRISSLKVQQYGRDTPIARQCHRLRQRDPLTRGLGHKPAPEHVRQEPLRQTRGRRFTMSRTAAGERPSPSTPFVRLRKFTEPADLRAPTAARAVTRKLFVGQRSLHADDCRTEDSPSYRHGDCFTRHQFHYSEGTFHDHASANVEAAIP